ncbi:MAG TPA: ABC transporter ATP-binding protein [Pseudonocardiaceae bacterium]|jgi:ABC-type dipeptide/oligopeptide/nickel transport system ATPase component|nr:ABC transporter ATP-binding protein [Pseudonocardiaceae bacterium]
MTAEPPATEPVITESPVLSLAGVDVHIDDLQLLHGVSVRVGAGETVGIVGETGSGKSMTLRAVMGLLPPRGHVSAGTIELAGEPLLGRSREQLRRLCGKRMSMIPQQPLAALNPILSIERQFRSIAKAHGRQRRTQTRVRAAELLAHVGIVDPARVLGSHVGELSGGLAQRVAIAMALYWEPQLLLADEPTTALDVTIQREILDLLATLAAEQRRGMLLVTHDLGVVANYCHSMVVMKSGRIVETGRTAEVLAAPKADYTRLLLSAGAIERGAA